MTILNSNNAQSNTEEPAGNQPIQSIKSAQNSFYCSLEETSEEIEWSLHSPAYIKDPLPEMQDCPPTISPR